MVERLAVITRSPILTHPVESADLAASYLVIAYAFVYSNSYYHASSAIAGLLFSLITRIYHPRYATHLLITLLISVPQQPIFYSRIRPCQSCLPFIFCPPLDLLITLLLALYRKPLFLYSGSVAQGGGGPNLLGIAY